VSRDPIFRHSRGIFTAAFLYAIGAMAWIDRVGSGRVPLLSDWLVVLLTLSSVAMFVCAAPTFASACELDNEGNCHPVPCQKLNPNVLMMQPAEDRYRNDLAAGLGASKVRRVLRQ